MWQSQPYGKGAIIVSDFVRGFFLEDRDKISDLQRGGQYQALALVVLCVP